MPKAWHYSRPSGMRTTGCRFVSGRMNPSSSQPSGLSVLMSPCGTPSSTPLDQSCREHWPLCRASGRPAEGLRLVPREPGRSEKQSTAEHLPESTNEGEEAGPFLARCGAVLGTLLRMPQNWVCSTALISAAGSTTSAHKPSHPCSIITASETSDSTPSLTATVMPGFNSA